MGPPGRRCVGAGGAGGEFLPVGAAHVKKKIGKLGKALKRKRAEELAEAAPVDSPEECVALLPAAEACAAALASRLDAFNAPALQPLRTLLYPLLRHQLDRGAHFEPPAPPPAPPSDSAVALDALAPLLRVARCLSVGALEGERGRGLRRALHPLVVDVGRREGVLGEPSLSARVSNAFHGGDFEGALALMRALRAAGERPRLGALQRWTRDVDLALGGAGGEALALRLLDGVLRVAARLPLPPQPAPLPPPAAAAAAAARLTRHPLWEPPGGGDGGGGGGGGAGAALPAGFDAPALAARARVVLRVPGAERRPAASEDLCVFAPPAGALRWAAPPPPPPGRFEVPHVPGAVLLPGVLTPSECAQLVALAEAVGFKEDASVGIEALHLFAGEDLGGPLLARVAPLLPAHGRLLGLNARWRLFRYSAGAVYRPHIDGCWPGSGVSPEGEWVEDVHGGAAVSRLTFLVYLNDGFAGGGTTFFTPGAAEGDVEARGVCPRAGAVLVFPHGDEGALVHEGSAVEGGGRKYVIRSDVLFEK